MKDELEGKNEFKPEFLDSIEITDLYPHTLKLKNDTRFMLLRKFDV